MLKNEDDYIKKYEANEIKSKVVIVRSCGHLEAVGGFKDYIFISSSAVYPETNIQQFSESQNIGLNKIWGNMVLIRLKQKNI